MKNLTKLSDILQKKRSEMPLESSPEAGWAKMQSALGKHLPVIKSPGVGGSTGAAGLKAISIVLAALSAAVTVYYFTQVNKTKIYRNETVNNHKQYTVRLPVNEPDSSKSYNKRYQPTARSADNNQEPDNSPVGENDADGMAAPKAGNKSTAKNKNGLAGTPGKISAVTSGGKSKDLKTLEYTKHPANTNKGYSLVAKQRNNREGTSDSMLTPGYQPDRNVQLLKKQTLANVKSILPDRGLAVKTKMPDSPGKKPVSAFVSDSLTTRKENTNYKTKMRGDQKKPAANRKPQQANVYKSNNLFSGGFDFGFLTGVSSSGSFTSKSSNANFYGSLPVDIYIGAFSTYSFNDKFGVNLQLKVLEPQQISGSYNHSNGSKIDSSKNITVTDTRKAYFVSVPVHGRYRLFNNLSINAGPEINIPVKQLSGITTLLPSNLKNDTAYYSNVNNELKGTRYQQKINFGWSAGISIFYKNLFLEADYKKSFSGYNVTSGFGNYKANNGSLQVTFGVSLKAAKSK